MSAYLIINYNEINEMLDPTVPVKRPIIHLNWASILRSQFQFCNKL
jgi:hypothetical protein